LQSLLDQKNFDAWCLQLDLGPQSDDALAPFGIKWACSGDDRASVMQDLPSHFLIIQFQQLFLSSGLHLPVHAVAVMSVSAMVAFFGSSYSCSIGQDFEGVLARLPCSPYVYLLLLLLPLLLFFIARVNMIMHIIIITMTIINMIVIVIITLLMSTIAIIPPAMFNTTIHTIKSVAIHSTASAIIIIYDFT
jgi:hypothetical protein